MINMQVYKDDRKDRNDRGGSHGGTSVCDSNPYVSQCAGTKERCAANPYDSSCK